MRTSLKWLYPTVAAVFILSLPVALSSPLRNTLSCKFASFFPTEKSPIPELEKLQVEEWVKERAASKKKTTKEAQKTLQEIGFSAALIGDVIARPKATFESFLWINLGSDDNPKDKPASLAKWSPVLSGDAVVGVVEYVGKTCSLVRLISDPELHIAVRVVRGAPQAKGVHAALEQLQEYLASHPEVFAKTEERTAFDFLLQKLKATLETQTSTLHLAKGEIRGNLLSPSLEGFGFNYDCADSYGPARDLRTGELLHGKGEKLPLVQKGDLLQTSGLDGIFPEGLRVAVVDSIAPLQEGAFSYELSARPAASALSDLNSVIVLAPRAEEPLVLPSRADRIKQEIQ